MSTSAKCCSLLSCREKLCDSLQLGALRRDLVVLDRISPSASPFTTTQFRAAAAARQQRRNGSVSGELGCPLFILHTNTAHLKDIQGCCTWPFRFPQRSPFQVQVLQVFREPPRWCHKGRGCQTQACDGRASQSAGASVLAPAGSWSRSCVSAHRLRLVADDVTVGVASEKHLEGSWVWRPLPCDEVKWFAPTRKVQEQI